MSTSLGSGFRRPDLTTLTQQPGAGSTAVAPDQAPRGANRLSSGSRYRRQALPAGHAPRSSGVRTPTGPQGVPDAARRGSVGGGAVAAQATPPRASLRLDLQEEEVLHIEQRVVHLPAAQRGAVAGNGADADDVPPPPPDESPQDLASFDDSSVPPPPDEAPDEPPPPPPLTAVAGLGKLVQGLGLHEKLASLSETGTNAMTLQGRTANRLGMAGSRFVEAVSTAFEPGPAFDADGAVASPVAAARTVIELAAHLRTYQGVRKQADESGQARQMRIAADHGQAYDRAPPGKHGLVKSIVSTRKTASSEPALPRQPIDRLVESTRSGMVAPLAALVRSPEFKLDALDRQELAQLEDALASLGIRLGSVGDKAHPRTELGRKFDQAANSLGIKEHRAPKAHAGYVPPHDEGGYAGTPVLSRDVPLVATGKRGPTHKQEVDKELAKAAQQLMLDEARRNSSVETPKKRGILESLRHGVREMNANRVKEAMARDADRLLEGFSNLPSSKEFREASGLLLRLAKKLDGKPASARREFTLAFSDALGRIPQTRIDRIADGIEFHHSSGAVGATSNSYQSLIQALRTQRPGFLKQE